MTKRQTRKVKRSVYLRYMPKMRGSGRIPHMNTFKLVCNPKDAHAKLLGVHSFKTQADSDDFVHVALAQLGEKELIVKLQSPGMLLNRELEITKRLRGQNNIITHTCDFKCLFNDIIWMNPLTKPASLCEEAGTSYHMIIMEFINNDLSKFLELDAYSDEMLRSIIKQVGLSLMEIHINNKLSHGDVNRGNILLDVGISKDIVYRIGNLTETINTFGNEVIWLDFQRGSIFNVEDDNDILYESARDEISMTYELISKWIQDKDDKEQLVKLMNDIMGTTSIKEMFNVIISF